MVEWNHRSTQTGADDVCSLVTDIPPVCDGIGYENNVR